MPENYKDYMNTPSFLKGQVAALGEALEETLDECTRLENEVNSLRQQIVEIEAEKYEAEVRAEFHKYRVLTNADWVLELIDDDSVEDFVKLNDIREVADAALKLDWGAFKA